MAMMRFGSGTYNVRQSEVFREPSRMANRSLVCSVHFLDGSQEDFELDKHARGQELMDRVFEHLELIEKDYFGLQFTDLSPEPDNMRWLEASKSIRRQMQCPPYVLYFRVKFYVSDPSKLQEEYTRYHFYLQIRHDINCGKLICPESSAALLGSYSVQSQFGDYSDEDHGDHYLDAFQFLRNQTASLIKKIMELHKLHRGQTPADAEFNFLDHAKRLDMYGVDLYHARDANLAEIQLGVNSVGIVVFQQGVKINTFSWAKVSKISFKRKQFFVQLRADEADFVDTVVGFNMKSTQASKNLWKSCIEHHTFFRLIAPPQAPPKGLFSLGSRYRYSGRTEYQTLEEMKRRARIERTFHRTGSRFSYARSTIGPMSRNELFTADRRQWSGSGGTTTTFGTLTRTTQNDSKPSDGIGQPLIRFYKRTFGPGSNSVAAALMTVNNAATTGIFASFSSRKPATVRAVDHVKCASPGVNLCTCAPVLSKSSTPTSVGSGGEQRSSMPTSGSCLSTTANRRTIDSIAEPIDNVWLSSESAVVNGRHADSTHFAALSASASGSSYSDCCRSENSGVVINGIHPRNGTSLTGQSNQGQHQPTSKVLGVTSSASSSSASSSGGSAGVVEGGGVENGTYRFAPSPSSATTAGRFPARQPGHVSQVATATGLGQNSGCGRETTFGSTVITSKIFEAVDDVLVGEQSFEFPHDDPSKLALQQQQTMPYSSVQHPPPSFHISRFTNGRATVAGASPKHQPHQSSSASALVTANGRGSPVTGSQNGYHAQVAGTSNGGGQRCSTASRNSITSNNGSLSHHRHSLVPSSNGVSARIGNGTNGHAAYQNGHQAEDAGVNALVTIRMKPDMQGRFGFNVKGGSDQNYPIIVSRVIPGSPAETCLPRLNEGDQVLMINGRDVSQHTHDQVVRFIRSCRESHTGELILIVRPNAYIGEDVDEPEFQYVPQTPHVADGVPRSDKLQQSILLLADNLASGSAIVQFEQLYRKKPGLTMDVARLTENLQKNRYRDISPYDATRVMIKNSAVGGDYVNASFINMEIPSSGIVNRYIAAQGPLPHTSVDFWQIIWEQMCPTVVMLTAAVERGRVKCHQYWPQLYETHDYGRLQLTCLREKETSVGVTREFLLVNQETKEERRVTQMQYIAWPDHGVPEDSKQFVDFVSQVRQSRDGMVEPMLVHCSAGIGRTGVLILMETAMCLIEANEPVYPLDIVRIMRDQRAMLIQTASQYKFVCESIVKVFNEGIVKPLAEYQSQR